MKHVSSVSVEQLVTRHGDGFCFQTDGALCALQSCQIRKQWKPASYYCCHPDMTSDISYQPYSSDIHLGIHFTWPGWLFNTENRQNTMWRAHVWQKARNTNSPVLLNYVYRQIPFSGEVVIFPEKLPLATSFTPIVFFNCSSCIVEQTSPDELLSHDAKALCRHITVCGKEIWPVSTPQGGQSRVVACRDITATSSLPVLADTVFLRRWW